ncbi:putative dinucleotide-binding enzyme [Rhodobium gokarnense]|uniref:Dinucleotide-binding enzyme n=2 Tax=Rhodobium gokarnense TaxID=364296 RepID=A0ABT3HES7_9HYPH|nr:NAD(P)-binding domain-containing protein [Rhodobium gokarnense]MCW2308904.1 putative dinucleotide-binding enzyme [Rhodobium gokarnense]
MKIGILGSGLMGAKLGRLWAACGHDVTFAYSRSPAKLERLARDCDAAHGTVAEAVADADALLLAVHWSRIDDVLHQAGDLAGTVVLNCCVPLDDSNTDIVVGMTTSGAEQLARKRPKARWVSCFNTSPSESFAGVFARKAEEPRPHLLVYGDDAGAKKIAGELVLDIGFEPLEAGGLRTARFVEPFAMVTAELAYGQPGGPALTYRFDKLRT